MSENRLARETSPYLLQHQDNPVHWWAWGPEALAEAKATGKPILLSVGYAACHWCHVMAHESFEDQATADVMNALFVNIKVDREERPDIDAVYMGALHRLGEQGGWPLTMFLDADARPFWGGTYFPKTARYGRSSFVGVLQQVARIFADDRTTVEHNATMLVSMLNEKPAVGSADAITDALISDLASRLVGAVDPVNGGLEGAPKFPQWSIFWLLWRAGIRYDQPRAREAVETTLVRICQGGIYDHLGGGFSRYSVDERWLAPHFEKMLYDNALLIDLMTEVYRETRNPLFNVRIAETVAWLEREMLAEGGAFAASLDADSEGEEGKFYVWTADEIVTVLGAEDAGLFASMYDVTPGGNWEGHTILNRLGSVALLDEPMEARLREMRDKLLVARAARIRPGFDDKVLADWNGLMIAALAKAFTVFDRAHWLALARRAFAFIETTMSVDGVLRHSYRAGKMTASATASDYANMIAAAIALHQATQEEAYLASALAWTAALDEHYWVGEGDGASAAGAYAQTSNDTNDVIVRLRSASDDAVPNANAIMLTNLMQLFVLTGDSAFADRAEAMKAAFGGVARGSLTQHTAFLANAIDTLVPQLVVVSTGRGAGELERAVLDVGLPGALVYRLACETDLPGLAGKNAIEGQAGAYLCVGPSCSPPITDAVALRERLIKLRSFS